VAAASKCSASDRQIPFRTEAKPRVVGVRYCEMARFFDFQIIYRTCCYVWIRPLCIVPNYVELYIATQTRPPAAYLTNDCFKECSGEVLAALIDAMNRRNVRCMTAVFAFTEQRSYWLGHTRSGGEIPSRDTGSPTAVQLRWASSNSDRSSDTCAQSCFGLLSPSADRCGVLASSSFL